MNTIDKKENMVVIAWYLLYVIYVLIPIAAGLDKYFNFLVDWEMYLNPSIPQIIGLTSKNFMLGVGALEICAGFLVFIKPKLGGSLVSLWLTLIAIVLFVTGSHPYHGLMLKHYDIAVRDIAMAIGAFVLVLLSKDLNKD